MKKVGRGKKRIKGENEEEQKRGEKRRTDETWKEKVRE